MSEIGQVYHRLIPYFYSPAVVVDFEALSYYRFFQSHHRSSVCKHVGILKTYTWFRSIDNIYFNFNLGSLLFGYIILSFQSVYFFNRSQKQGLIMQVYLRFLKNLFIHSCINRFFTCYIINSQENIQVCSRKHNMCDIHNKILYRRRKPAKLQINNFSSCIDMQV